MEETTLMLEKQPSLGWLKSTGKKSKSALIAFYIYNNWRIRKRYETGRIDSPSGAARAQTKIPVSTHLAYINRTFNDYVKYCDITPDRVRNKRILEIGPGDNLGVALKFLAAGAAQVVCLDKYLRIKREQEREIYRALREQLDDGERRNFDAAVNLAGELEMDPRRLMPIYGTAMEQAQHLLEPESFDLIVSRSVIEHLYDPDAAFSIMHRLLVRGGRLAHKIDFRDHGMFSKKGFHPLTFLTIPDSIYRLMTHSGKPNRKLINYYRKKMAELGYEAKLQVTHLIGSEDDTVRPETSVMCGADAAKSVALVRQIRPKLQRAFQTLPDEDLMISGIYMTAKNTALPLR